MGDLNNTFGLTRKVVFGVAILFSFIVLILGALVTNYTTTYFYGGYFSYAALGIATSVLTLLSLPVMLFFSIKRKGAITSMLAIEVGWTWLLWILWLSTGASAASTYWIGNCGQLFYLESEAACRETQALTAFSFLNWIFLFAYNIFLFALVIRQQMRGNTSIWTSYVTEVDYTRAGSTIPHSHEAKGTPTFAPQYPPTATATPPTVYTPQQVVTPQQTMSHYPQV